MEQIFETRSASSQIDGVQTHCIDSPCLKLLKEEGRVHEPASAH